ncbi:hypothetical protein BDK51DRAFT_29704 [Blyttiomyces helicus]|uniref:Uncharacterized protein n=1 Tax=Blyttiomyces helicus TaxID=388810 RepID=A0A4P9WQK5_9FUNG|nr:hypothetical protein BDK51DRAFT_29704 [Blyttiomyces helicus]|eukprot:RKO94098.1 hypothetical protein BDK51DRAFT_29704 [Blyttiomyces helicus]
MVLEEKLVVLFGNEEGADVVAVPGKVVLAVQGAKRAFDEVRLLDFLLAEAEGGDEAVEVGVVGRYRRVVLEADVGPLVANLGDQDVWLVLKPIFEHVPEVERVSCLDVLGLERLRDVVAEEDEGLRALFGGDRVNSIRGFNDAIEFVGGEVGTDVKSPRHVVAAVKLELWKLLLGVVADAGDSGASGGHCRRAVKCDEVPRWSGANDVL